MLNHLYRYAPVSRLIRQMRPRRILEVGSGWQGMAPYTGRTSVGCDPCLMSQERPRSGCTLMDPVAGSACDLPFRSDSFDLVVSLDMLEHIPGPMRAQAVAELIRVSRVVAIIGFPRGRHWARWERRTATWYRWTGRSTPDWLSEHFQLGLPSERLLPDLLRSWGLRYRSQGNANNLLHFITNLLEGSKLRGITVRLSRLVGLHPDYVRASGGRPHALSAILRFLSALLPLTDLGQTVRRLTIIHTDDAGQPLGTDRDNCGQPSSSRPEP